MKLRRSFFTPYSFLLPAIILLSLTVLVPALQAFALSFTSYDYDITQPPKWIGWANFQQLLQDRLFWQTIRNTLLYLVTVVPVLVILPLGLAIIVNQKLKGIDWFRTAFYTPVVISTIVAGIAWKALYAQNGLLNQLFKQVSQWLQQINFNNQITVYLEAGIPWLTAPQFSLWSVMLVTIWKGLGYYMVIYLAGLQSIAPELYEAAAIDGTDGWQKHWDITLPLMRPYLFLVAIISAISATKVFEEVYVMTQGGPRNSSKTVIYYLYEQAFQNLNISYACTIGLVMFLGILGLSMINLKLSKQTNNI